MFYIAHTLIGSFMVRSSIAVPDFEIDTWTTWNYNAAKCFSRGLTHNFDVNHKGMLLSKALSYLLNIKSSGH